MVAVNASAGLKSPADIKAKDFCFGISSEMLASTAVIWKGDFTPVVAVSAELTKTLTERWKGIVL